jgi:hypothetical protein
MFKNNGSGLFLADAKQRFAGLIEQSVIYSNFQLHTAFGFAVQTIGLFLPKAVRGGVGKLKARTLNSFAEIIGFFAFGVCSPIKSLPETLITFSLKKSESIRPAKFPDKNSFRFKAFVRFSLTRFAQIVPRILFEAKKMRRELTLIIIIAMLLVSDFLGLQQFYQKPGFNNYGFVTLPTFIGSGVFLVFLLVFLIRRLVFKRHWALHKNSKRRDRES